MLESSVGGAPTPRVETCARARPAFAGMLFFSVLFHGMSGSAQDAPAPGTLTEMVTTTEAPTETVQESASATSSAPELDARLETPLVLADEAPPRRRVHAGHLLWNALVGDLVGAAIGGLVAVAIAGVPGCTNGESEWLSGFQCGAGFFFAAAAGALTGATLGGPLGVMRIGGARHAGGDDGLALLGGATGAAVGGILTGILTDELQQPTIALVIGGGTGVLLSTLLSVFLYDGSRPPPNRGTTIAPFLAPTDYGVVVGAGGTFF